MSSVFYEYTPRGAKEPAVHSICALACTICPWCACQVGSYKLVDNGVSIRFMHGKGGTCLGSREIPMRIKAGMLPDFFKSLPQLETKAKEYVEQIAKFKAATDREFELDRLGEKARLEAAKKLFDGLD